MQPHSRINKTAEIFLLVTGWYILSSLTPFEGFTEQRESRLLFKIGRSKDPDQIFYNINLDERGNLNPRNPVRIYWIKHTKGGLIEPLTLIQRKLAYGLKFETVSEKEAVFHFVSYKKRIFRINGKDGNRYCVNTVSNNERIIVRKIFVQIDGGSFLFPKISSVELHGENAQTGEKTIEIIIP